MAHITHIQHLANIYQDIVVMDLPSIPTPKVDNEYSYLLLRPSPLQRTGTHHSSGRGDPQQNRAEGRRQNPATQVSGIPHTQLCRASGRTWTRQTGLSATSVTLAELKASTSFLTAVVPIPMEKHTRNRHHVILLN